MRILWRHLSGMYLRAVVATLGVLVAIYLVVDYVDRARFYTGRAWLRWVLELYACKSVLVAHQLAPAALLLGAGVMLAQLRRSGQLTALRALAVGPRGLLGPLIVVCGIGVVALVGADEYVLGPASVRADEILTGRFKMMGDWRQVFGEQQWFRGKKHIYRLRVAGEHGFYHVTIYSLSEDFRLSQRIDAREMVALGGNRWRLVDGTVRDLNGEVTQVDRFAEREIVLDEDDATFRVMKGRPEQMRIGALREQREVREKVGLPAERYTFALHNKIAYPLGALPGMLIACALGLRKGRRSTLSVAIAEGFIIIVVLWTLLVVCKAAALSGAMSPALGAWLPVFVFAAASALALRRAA